MVNCGQLILVMSKTKFVMETTKKPVPHSNQFVEIVDDCGRQAYQACMVVFTNMGKHVILAAPTIAALEDIWNKVSSTPLNRGAVQFVSIVKRKPSEIEEIDGNRPRV